MEEPKQQQNNKTSAEKRQLVREWRWWKTNPEKLTKLEQAFSFGCTDKEACGFAGISEKQLYYYERINPEFGSRKAVLKDALVLQARMIVASRMKESYGNAMDYLKKKRKHEFGENISLPDDPEKIGELGPTGTNIVIVDFSQKNENQ